MGSEISSFVIEPLVGGGVVALAIFAIINENKDDQKRSRLFSIAAIAVLVLLIVLNIVVTMVSG